MFGLFRVFRRFGVFLMLRACGVMFMKLLGAIGAFEFMALAGNAKQGNSRKKDGEKFHRAA